MNCNFTYSEALEYLEKSYEKNNKKGFDVMRKVLATLGDPHKELKIIHIAGTNGKGSACAYLTNILLNAGYNTGTFISPHLFDYNERFSVNNEYIGNEDLARHVGIVKAATELALKDESATMSFFEIFTVVCFNYFYEKKVDLAIIEVGLGGRLDPTNIIENPLLSVITSIGFDHMNILGESIEQIAYEKAGVIKKNCPAVLYCNQKSVYNIFKNTANELEAGFFYKDRNFEIDIKSRSLAGTVYSVKIDRHFYDDINIRLLGDFQVYNSANVIYAAEVLRICGLNISEDNIRAGLAKTSWQCRMEIIQSEPMVMLDGAHNLDAVDALVKACETYFKEKRIIMVMGFLSDKEYGKMTELLSGIADTAVFTNPPGKRAVVAHDLIKYNKCAGAAYVEIDYKKSLDLAKSLVFGNDVIVVAGSLYLAGAARRYLAKV